MRSPRPRLLVIAIGMALSSQALADTFLVTSNADSGEGSLRQAVSNANQTVGPDSIQFAPGLGPILLNSAIVVQGSLTIIGPVAGQILDGQNVSQIFRFTGKSGQDFELKRLILQNGSATGNADFGFPCSASDGRGGALCVFGNLTMDEVVIRNSQTEAADGGGIHVANGLTRIENSVIRDSTASGLSSAGGGVNQQGGGLLLVNSVVTQNESADEGGGIHTSEADATVVNSTLSFNRGGKGGGVFVSNGLVTVTNSTLSGNESGVSGGAIYARFGDVFLSNSTITQNSAPPGLTKGVYLYSSSNSDLTLNNTILAGNGFGETGENIGFIATATGNLTVDSSHSIFGDPVEELSSNTNSVLTNAPGLAGIGSFDCGLVAGIGAFKQCVPVYGLREDSPAVDAGAELGNLAFDQRGQGFARTVGVARDIGAFELQPVPELIVTNVNDSGPGSLRAMVDRANVTPGVLETVGFESDLGEIILTTGQIEVRDSVRIVGPAGGQAVSGNSRFRVFGVTAAGADLELRNLALREGRASFTAIVAGNEQNLTACSEGLPYGGAVCGLRNVTITNSSIRSSATTGEQGVGGGAFVGGALAMENSVIANNSTNGMQAVGGGLAVDTGSVIIRNSWIDQNSTTGQSAPGGGIFATGTLTLDRSTVSRNTTAGDGSRGGGLYLLGNSYLINSTVSGNRTSGGTVDSDSHGGGLFASANVVSIRNSTITGNLTAAQSAGDGLAVVREENGAAYQLILDSVILSGNGTDNLDAGADRNPNTGIFVAANASLDGDDELPVGNPVNIFSNDPQLGSLTDNGCTVPAGSPVAGDSACVPTHYPEALSPVIDAGSHPAPALLSDQRGEGFARVLGSAADIGAVETDPEDPTPEPGPDLIFADGFESS